MEFLMIKRREFISRRGGLRGRSPSTRSRRRSGSSTHRRVHSRISLRHSARSCVKWIRSRTATSLSSTAGPKAKTIDFRRSRQKLVFGAR